ncbi:MAG TPA: LolA-related protein [Steroidobacteraceae bacterium]|nr:LolA-related protein [Steroidobacteraceae bacterium]
MRPLAALLAFLPVAAWGASALDTLLQRLARPAPSSTAFVEAHFSPLLTRPLVVSGRLEYLGPDALARDVEKPYRERAEIRGDTATVAREGEPAQSFALERAPEMRGLLASFTDLLGGNRAALERAFRLDLHGSPSDWTLGLTPRDPRILERIRSVVVSGRGAEPRCLTIFQANDDTTIMLLADAASTALPAAPDRRWFDAQCRGQSG